MYKSIEITFYLQNVFSKLMFDVEHKLNDAWNEPLFLLGSWWMTNYILLKFRNFAWDYKDHCCMINQICNIWDNLKSIYCILLELRSYRKIFVFRMIEKYLSTYLIIKINYAIERIVWIIMYNTKDIPRPTFCINSAIVSAWIAIALAWSLMVLWRVSAVLESILIR